MKEEELGRQSPASLRLAEAEYFLWEYIRHCGPPIDSYFKMVCYFDAFLFSLVSVEEMIGEEGKRQLQTDVSFRFLKALRNISTHHSILAAPIQGKFERPFSRRVTVSVGGSPNDSSRLSLRFDVLRQIFDVVEAERKQEAKTLGLAREFVNDLEASGKDVFLEEIMQHAFNSAKGVLANA